MNASRAVLLAVLLAAAFPATLGAIDFTCLELPDDIEALPAACNGFEWCACLDSELTSTRGGEAAGLLQAHIYPTDESTPGVVAVDTGGGTLHIDRLEVGDVIGKLRIDLNIGQAENFLLDYSLIVTEVDLEAGHSGIAAFDVRIVATNPTSIAVLTYDPLDAQHSEGLLYAGELESFGPNGGFLLRYELIPEPPDRDRGIEIGDLTTPGFNVPALVSLLDPAVIEPEKELYVLPSTGGTLVITSEIVSIVDPTVTKEFETEVDIEAVETEPVFRRGDSDGNGRLEVTDPINNLSFQFLGTFEPPCRDALDYDDNGAIEVTDPIANLTHQFLGGEAPAAPGKDACGPDPTPDRDGGDLGCEAFPEEGCL